jgi:hypothetical protein
MKERKPVFLNLQKMSKMPLFIGAAGAGTMEAVQAVTEQVQNPEAVQLILQLLIGIVTLFKLLKKPKPNNQNL